MNRHLIRSFTTILFLGYAALSSASDKAAVIFPAEGNRTCSDYAANSVILQMGTTSPQTAGTFAGTENPMDADTSGETANYAVNGGTVASFSAATTPIDYALLKSSKYVSLIIYPKGGVTEDANMKLTVNGTDQLIDGINLCYGLGNEAPTPPPLKSTKSCNAEAFLDATGIACPTNGQRTLVCNFELDEPFFGLNNGSDDCCVCNSGTPDGTLAGCDPSVASGSPNACPDPASSAKKPTEVTTHIELNNDPYYCKTVSGIRTCQNWPY